MNAKNFYSGLLLAGCSLALFSSCEKEVYDATKVQKTSELVVPEGFDWAMTRGVTISMESKNETYASFYLDKDCKDLVAEMPVQAGTSSVNLMLPTASSKIWVKYPIGEGKEEVKEIAIKQSAVTKAGGAGNWTADNMFPDYANNSSNTNFVLYQPRKNQYGTIMFEDMWPETGDYDFNDYVVNYNIIAEQKANDFENVYVTINLKLRAIGGSRPYRFCIRIGSKSNSTAMELRKNEVKLDKFTITNNIADGKVEMLEDTEFAVIALTDFDKLKSKTGGNFYNTENAHLISNDQTPIITIHLIVNRPNEDAYRLLQYGFGSEFAFDYFLQNTDNNREIHFISYPPTDMYTGYDNDKKDNNTTFYCSDKQFVWALKAPVEMGWCRETKDIKFVYSDFAKWVTMGGDRLEGDSNWDSNNQWYNRPEKGENYIDPKEH